MDDDANLIEINTRENDGGGVEQRVQSNKRSNLLIDRYDARGLLDEFSLRQLSVSRRGLGLISGIDSVSVNCRAYSSSFDEDVSGEEKARNIVRYEGLDKYPSAVICTKSNNTAKDGGENLNRINSSYLDTYHEKEKPFQLSEELSKGLPSNVQLVSVKHSSMHSKLSAIEKHLRAMK